MRRLHDDYASATRCPSVFFPRAKHDAAPSEPHGPATQRPWHRTAQGFKAWWGEVNSKCKMRSLGLAAVGSSIISTRLLSLRAAPPHQLG